MSDIRDAVDYYLDCLREGEDAFFSLLELGPEALPLLIGAAARPENGAIRAELVQVIWQYRQPEAIDFLAGALDDPAPDVWKQALDGLVVIGGAAAADRVREALDRLAGRGAANGLSAEWLREALEQIGEPGRALIPEPSEPGRTPDQAGG